MSSMYLQAADQPCPSAVHAHILDWFAGAVSYHDGLTNRPRHGPRKSLFSSCRTARIQQRLPEARNFFLTGQCPRSFVTVELNRRCGLISPVKMNCPLIVIVLLKPGKRRKMSRAPASRKRRNYCNCSLLSSRRLRRVCSMILHLRDQQTDVFDDEDNDELGTFWGFL